MSKETRFGLYMLAAMTAMWCGHRYFGLLDGEDQGDRQELAWEDSHAPRFEEHSAPAFEARPFASDIAQHTIPPRVTLPEAEEADSRHADAPPRRTRTGAADDRRQDRRDDRYADDRSRDDRYGDDRDTDRRYADDRGIDRPSSRTADGPALRPAAHGDLARDAGRRRDTDERLSDRNLTHRDLSEHDLTDRDTRDVADRNAPGRNPPERGVARGDRAPESTRGDTTSRAHEEDLVEAGARRRSAGDVPEERTGTHTPRDLLESAQADLRDASDRVSRSARDSRDALEEGLDDPVERGATTARDRLGAAADRTARGGEETLRSATDRVNDAARRSGDALRDGLDDLTDAGVDARGLLDDARDALEGSPAGTAADDLRRRGSRLANDARGAIDDSLKDVSEKGLAGASRAADRVRDAAGRTAEDARRGLANAADDVNSGLERRADDLLGRARNAADDPRAALEDAADTVTRDKPRLRSALTQNNPAERDAAGATRSGNRGTLSNDADAETWAGEEEIADDPEPAARRPRTAPRGAAPRDERPLEEEDLPEETELEEEVATSRTRGAPARTADNQPAPRQAKPLPPRPTAPPTAGDEYVVHAQDTYWSISKRFFGTGGYAEAIREHNLQHVTDPSRLQPGDVLRIPSAEEFHQLYPDLRLPPLPDGGAYLEEQPAAEPNSAPIRPSDHVVRGGESLFDIARSELGGADRWVDIYNLNRDLIGEEVDQLPAGMKLAMPTRSAIRRGGAPRIFEQR